MKTVVLYVSNLLLAGGLSLYLKDNYLVIVETDFNNLFNTCFDSLSNFLIIEAESNFFDNLKMYEQLCQKLKTKLKDFKCVFVVDGNSYPQVLDKCKNTKNLLYFSGNIKKLELLNFMKNL